MNLRPCLFALLAFAAAAHADELTKNVQGSLKEQGFFYGDVTGVNGPETIAAVKRFQIRNGLEVTGTINKETLDALKLEGDAPAPNAVEPEPKTVPIEKPRPVAPAAPVERETRPPANLRKDNSTRQSDEAYVRRPSAAPRDEVDAPGSVVPPPVPPRANSGGVPSGPYAQVFRGTPYASAPAPVQEGTIKQAKRALTDTGFYHGAIDGRPTPGFEEALLQYQRFLALPLTGYMDMETLAAMRLLPGRGGYATKPANPAVRSVPGKPLRGVWIQ